MPTTPVDLLGVHWAVEVALPGSLMWGSVHGMIMSKGLPNRTALAMSPEPSTAVSPSIIPSDWRDPVTTDEIRTWFWEACRTDETCWKYNAGRASGKPYHIDYSGRNHTEGVARDLATWPQAQSRQSLTAYE